ncbi:unnamed protein product, partial [Effrenium voratum]
NLLLVNIVAWAVYATSESEACAPGVHCVSAQRELGGESRAKAHGWGEIGE